MIKANYVRVNNYVNYKGNIITVVPKTIDDIGFQQSLNSEFYTGIPLTEEWLFRFGFEKSEGEGLNFYAVWDGKGHFYLNFKFQPHMQLGVRKEFKYIHELQNLYFALTGKELTL